MFPKDNKYTEDHEWIRADEGVYFVGITAYATEQLGDVTFVELPEIGMEVHKGEVVAMVESVKAASDVYAPTSGRVSEVNDVLEAQPELVNASPHGEGWFFKLDDVPHDEFDALMDADAYEQYVAERSQ